MNKTISIASIIILLLCAMLVSLRLAIKTNDVSRPIGQKILELKVMAPQVKKIKGTLSRGDSVYSILKENSVSNNEAYKITNAINKKVNLKKSRPGYKYVITKSTAGKFLSFTYKPTPIDKYKVKTSTQSIYKCVHEKSHLNKMIIGYNGTIKSSLYESMVNGRRGMASLAMEFSDVFAWQVDFLTDPRPGDKFRFIWEKYISDDGEYITNGKILAAEYISKNKLYSAVLYKGRYYSFDGKSTEKAFLKSPLNYRRISSYFTKKRWHPVLKYYRPHLGIDYAAQRGTPVVSVGNGRVKSCKWNGGFGRHIKIKHNNNSYETWYGHLYRYAKGIKVGNKVKQGQVIGYVGSSGLSTGPHLDFRVKKNGKFVNYLRLKFPPAKSISKQNSIEFEQIKRKYIRELNSKAA